MFKCRYFVEVIECYLFTHMHSMATIPWHSNHPIVWQPSHNTNKHHHDHHTDNISPHTPSTTLTPSTPHSQPQQTKGPPWEAPPGSGQAFSREPNGEYKNTKLVTKVKGGDCYALQVSDKPFTLGDTMFAPLTATKNLQDGSVFSFSSGLIPQQGAC